MESIALGRGAGERRMARRFVSDLFVERRPRSVVGRLLLTSELVANVVRHARTDLTVAIQLDECARIEVHDGAAATDGLPGDAQLRASSVPADVHRVRAWCSVWCEPWRVASDSPTSRAFGTGRSCGSRLDLARPRRTAKP